MLRAAYGPDRPEWWCLAVMARHFIDCYEQADRDQVGGSLETWNQVSLCAAHHRYLKHEVGSLSVRGIAPDDLQVTMGDRVYRNDAIVVPAWQDETLDQDPWETTAWETTPWV